MAALFSDEWRRKDWKRVRSDWRNVAATRGGYIIGYVGIRGALDRTSSRECRAIATASESYSVVSEQAMTAWLTLPERDAVIAGVRAADAALVRSGRSDVLHLFVKTEQLPYGEPRLEALRAYAELRRALLPQGRVIPGTSLLAAGFTTEQVAWFDQVIASTPTTEREFR